VIGWGVLVLGVQPAEQLQKSTGVIGRLALRFITASASGGELGSRSPRLTGPCLALAQVLAGPHCPPQINKTELGWVAVFRLPLEFASLPSSHSSRLLWPDASTTTPFTNEKIRQSNEKQISQHLDSNNARNLLRTIPISTIAILSRRNHVLFSSTPNLQKQLILTR